MQIENGEPLCRLHTPHIFRCDLIHLYKGVVRCTHAHVAGFMPAWLLTTEAIASALPSPVKGRVGDVGCLGPSCTLSPQGEEGTVEDGLHTQPQQHLLHEQKHRRTLHTGLVRHGACRHTTTGHMSCRVTFSH